MASDVEQVLARHFPPTRLVVARSLSTPEHAVYLKLECELPTGSFKVRGALYALSVNMERRRIGEVVAASTGNHGAAVAYGAMLLGVRATIFLPQQANPVKAAKIASFGARIVEAGATLSAAIDAAADYCARGGAFFLHDASEPDIPTGTGTIASEVLDQLPEVDAIYVPMGDTALIRGVASVAKQRRPDIRIVGVVAANAPAYYLSWQSGSPVETASADTIADGLAVTRPLGDNVSAIRRLVDDVRLVTDEELLSAINFLATREGVVAEPAGAAPIAALRKAPPEERRHATVLIVTGSNISDEVRARASVDVQR